MTELIANYCRQLKWGNSIVENYQDIKAGSHEEFLLKLLEMELLNRELTRKNRCLKQAGFDVMKTFQGYGFEQVTIPASITLDEIKNASFIEKKENLILYGPVGTGKTPGSPPLARGPLFIIKTSFKSLGITPARAGTTH